MFFIQNRIGLGSAAVALPAAFFLLPGELTSVEKETPKGHVVHIQGMLFQPAKLQISPGDSITWINDDILLHAVKSTDPKNGWQSKDLPPHASWTKTFAQGSPYICPYHPTMTGEVIMVGPKSASGAR